MRVPLDWLKEYVGVTESAEEVGVRLTMGGSEVEGIEETDYSRVLDVYITPNRGDSLSMVGVAREVAALYDLPLNAPTPPESETGGTVLSFASVTMEAPQLCPRYAARVVRNVRVKPSPQWMQDKLNAAGQKPISNVVDVTNYVMLELGQPLHAFDLDKLAGKKIVVRTAREGETLTTLDGIERELTSAMLVIADAEKPVAVAGVMGGANSEVSDATKTLLLESAHFAPLSVRRTSRALGLRTEASYRFERVVDPTICRIAVDRACELLAQMGAGEVVDGVIDEHPAPIAGKEITLRVSKCVSLLGIPDITAKIAADCLRRLELGVEIVGNGLNDSSELETLKVHVPPRRADLLLEEDLIEEVGRIYGYENIPETLPIGVTTRGGDSAESLFAMEVRRALASCGLQEAVTHSLCAPFPFDTEADVARRVPVRNALSTDISTLRRSIVQTLLDVAKRNASRGATSLGLFEVGRVWQNEGENGEIIPREFVAVGGLIVGSQSEAGWRKDTKSVSADFGTMRGILEGGLFAPLQIESVSILPLGESAAALPMLHPGRAALLQFADRDYPEGVLGELHPNVAETLGFRERVYVFEVSLEALRRSVPAARFRYHSLSKFPSVSRDIAPRLDESVTFTQIESAIQSAGVNHLEAFRLTDIYRGEPLPAETKSVTLNFAFRSSEGTLGETEVNAALDALRSKLVEQCGATFAG